MPRTIINLKAERSAECSFLAASPPAQVVPKDAARVQNQADGFPVLAKEPGCPMDDGLLGCLPGMVAACMHLSRSAQV